jgi:uncharacterized protein YndB with AHSA1/START domain
VSPPTRAAAGPGRTLAAESGLLVIADITGYTSYVVASPLQHAEDVVADVTATVADELAAALRINKLEGDAVFAYGLDGDLSGSTLLDAIDACYFAFRRRVEGIERATRCSCAACAKLPELDLKFVVHHGSFIRRARRGGEELTGSDVIVVHRLLKNRVPESLELRGYALVTEAAVAALGLDPEALGLLEHDEDYDGVGRVRGFVVDLGDRFETQKERRRVRVRPEEAAFELERLLPAPPAVAWEYLTEPERRSCWVGGRVEEESGGRRGVGTTTFCVDSRASVYEEILDWRPFTYFTELRTVPGSARVVVTTELEAAEGGTLVRVLGRRPERGARARWAVSRRGLVRELRAAHGRLEELMRSTEGGTDAGERAPLREPARA